MDSKKATPKKATPKKVTPKKVTPKKVTPKKATPKKVAPKKVAPTPKPTLTPTPTVITLKQNKADFNLENKAIYFAKLDTCRFCNEMKTEWEKAKQNNISIKIYEIDGNYLDKYPDIKSYVPGFPTILRYNNDQFKVFNRLRTAQNFSNFMRNG
tara:strand:- start:127 stop:588 length:462 start_codon:yes stop_codon:yes gene_type:complete